MPRPFSAIVGACAAIWSLSGCGASAPPASAAPPATFTRADPSFLDAHTATYQFRLGRPNAFEVTRSGDAVLFLRSGPRSFVQSLYRVDPATGEEHALLSAEQILAGGAEEISAEEKARRERLRLTARGIASYSASRDGKWLLVPISGRLFVVERASGRVIELAGAEGSPEDPQISPDGARVVCVRGGDIYVTEVGSGHETRLTRTASATVSNGLAEFVAQEEMDRYHGAWWSPDGQTLAFQETDTAGVERMHLADPMHPEEEPQAWAYPRPGMANARVRVGLVPATGGEPTWVVWDRDAFPYLATVKWAKNAPLTLVVENRRQTELRVLAVDAASGQTRELLVERDPVWLNLDQDTPRWLESGAGFVWATERGGGWQLELRGPDGALRSVLTAPELGYRKLLDVDEARGEVFVAASPEPTEQHLYRVPLDPNAGPPQQITKEPGVHEAVFSEGHGVYVHTAVTEAGRSFTVRRRDGSAVATLRSEAEAPPFQANLELTEVGERAFRAALVRPRGFVAGRPYPTLLWVYGGPDAQMVTAEPDRYLMQQWVADHGFVVVMIDGRGTPARGRAWERALRDRPGEVPLEDQVAGLRALAARYPELDLGRVGVYGASYGGYMAALAVLRRGDLFRVAVARAPVTDWRDYDTHYTERYLGLPAEAPEPYRRSSLLTYAGDLERPLLLIHGTADDNVYFMHSLKLSNALFRAGKHHELLPLAGTTHMVPDPVFARRLHVRIVDFLMDHLQ